MRSLLLAAALTTAIAAPSLAADAAEKDAVVKAITDAYVNGVHASFDPAAMRRGFHPDFRMLVLSNGAMTAVPLEEWIARLQKSAAGKTGAPPQVSAEFPQVDVTGTVASARVELTRDGRHTFTDQLLLYKFADGWKIVSKAFYAHPR